VIAQGCGGGAPISEARSQWLRTLDDDVQAIQFMCTAVSVRPNTVGRMRLLTIAARKALSVVAVITVALAVVLRSSRANLPLQSVSTSLSIPDCSRKPFGAKSIPQRPTIDITLNAGRSVELKKQFYADAGSLRVDPSYLGVDRSAAAFRPLRIGSVPKQMSGPKMS
jgi:hypothetical protein